MLTNLNVDEYKGLLDKYEKALTQLANWSIPVNSTSRLILYKTQLELFSKGHIPSNRKELADFAFILIEIDEIIDIINSIHKSPDNELRERLKDLQKDVLIRTQNENRARNSQFELYVKALIEMGGLDCKLGNPDILVRTNRGELQIEAKRPNERGLEFNFKKALKQLDPKKPGLIAISLDHLLLGNHNIIEIDENETGFDALEFLGKSVSEWLEKNKNKLQRLSNNKKSACGILFLITH